MEPEICAEFDCDLQDQENLPPSLSHQSSASENILDFSGQNLKNVSFQPTPTRDSHLNLSVSSLRSTFNTRTETALLGTPDYIAPEILSRKSHDKAVDFWALGCCMYQFMIGMAPFTDQTVKDIFRRIQEGKIDWPDGEVSQ